MQHRLPHALLILALVVVAGCTVQRQTEEELEPVDATADATDTGSDAVDTSAVDTSTTDTQVADTASTLPDTEPIVCAGLVAEITDDPSSDDVWRQIWRGSVSSLFARARLVNAPGREIGELQWSLVAAPNGAPRLIHGDGPSTSPVELRPRLVGQYVIEVTGTDSLGMPVCAPARAEVVFEAPAGLYVELSWTSLSDPDPTDECLECAPDLDLHLLSPAPGSTWWERRSDRTEGDCHFNNANPDWGVHGDPTDDPSYLWDGPIEAISLPQPAHTDGAPYDAPYRIGVYYYNDWHFAPPTFAQVRVYTDGGLVPTTIWPGDSQRGRALYNADPDLELTGDLWVPGEIDWSADGATLTEVDEISGN